VNLSPDARTTIEHISVHDATLNHLAEWKGERLTFVYLGHAGDKSTLHIPADMKIGIKGMKNWHCSLSQ